MPKSIDDLVECCLENVVPPIPVLADYFSWDIYIIIIIIT